MPSHLLPIILTMTFAMVWSCPSQESIAPACICKDLGDGPMMLCSNLMSPEELIPPIKASDSIDMFALTIIDSSLLYIPYNLFLHSKYEKIRFANSEIMSLSNTELAFVGLEDHLEEIRATDAHYITQWDWSQLKNLRRLKFIDINLIAMYSLDQEFPALESLKTLGISKAEISFIHPTAFRELRNLRYLDLHDNDISEMVRAMLPDPAEEMTLIDLSGNQLTSFPSDMFTSMPNLMELILHSNKFVTLEEDTFLWPMENLQLLNLGANEIRCDCRLRWMVQVKKPMYFTGNCTQPENLNGVGLRGISDNVLWCFQ